MASGRTEIQVGAALVAALFVLVFGLMWFQQYQLGVDRQTVNVHFAKVGGLGVGDPVAVRGINMGKVAAVELVDDGVLVSVNLRGSVQMREDAVVRLGSAGIMGERMVAVEPGTGAAIDVRNRIFEGVYESASTELVGQFEQFNEQVMSFLSRADQVLASLQEDGLLVGAVQSTVRAADAATALLEANRDDLKRSSRALADVAESLDSFLDAHGTALGESAQGLARATTSLDTITVRLTGVLDGADDVITALREQRGPAGRMIYDEAAGEDLAQSLAKLRFLVEDLQRNPQRYLTVKIF